MITLTKSVALTSVLCALVACGSSDPEGTGSTDNNSTTGQHCDLFSDCFQRCYCETQDKAACEAQCAPSACSQLGTCFERCYCETQDSQTCASQCSVVSGSGGTGGTSSGTGGETTSTGGTGTGGAAQLTPTGEVMISTETFTVAPGDEVYKCQNFANPIGADVDIIYSEVFLAPGSHHMFAFRQQGAVNGGLEDCSGLELAEYIHTAQTPESVVSYPPGIGRFLPASDGIRLQAHYLNTTQDTITGQITLTLHYVDPSQVTAHAAAVFLNNVGGINVPPGTSTVTSSAQMSYDIKLIGAGSHMHSRGVNFVSNVVGGQTIYETTDWDEPDPVGFDPPLDISAGQSIQWACTYQNNENFTMRFGDSAATDEMCIFSGVYYPAPGGGSIIVNQIF